MTLLTATGRLVAAPEQSAPTPWATFEIESLLSGRCIALSASGVMATAIVAEASAGDVVTVSYWTERDQEGAWVRLVETFSVDRTYRETAP